jgi:hypothetical protein
LSKRTYRDFEVKGRAEDHELSIVVNDTGRIIFGTCGCEHFAEHLLNRGPCAHMVALLEASEDRRKDGPTSVAAVDRPSRIAGDDAAGDDDIDDEDSGEDGAEDEQS